MSRWMLGLFVALGLGFGQPAQAQEADLKKMTDAQIITQAAELHPSALYVLSARLMAKGQHQEAANWMYAGQLRYRILLTANKVDPASSDRVLFSALSEQVGRPVNEHIAGDVDEWITAINWALHWDATTPSPLLDRTQHAAAITQVRDGLVKLRDDVDGRRAEIARERTKNNLPNR